VSLFDQHRGALIESTSAWAWATARQHAVVVRQFEAWLRSHHAWAPPIGRRAFLSLWGRVQTEVPALIAFLETADPEYADTVDRRLQSLADDPYWSGREMAADRRAADLGRRLLARLDAHRQRYELQTSPEEWTAARAAAAMLVEFLAACAVLPEKTFQEPAIRRNEFMAENIEWILDEAAPGAKVVVWAHNDVIGRQPLALGEALAKRFGSDYRPLALTFGTGSIHAIHTPIKWDPPFAQHLDVHVLAGPSPEQIETLFLRAELDVFALDFRDSREDPALRAWLDQPRGMWTIGPGYAREREDRGEYATEVMLREQFDGLVFIASTTPVELNRRTRLRFKMAEPE
jgi:erythromycin esterase